uniref:AlNc14C101G6033 protein n=1 Tax=Albugo laibachii Nc14 TaxID=890382 RepID=F0WHH0_9STRA|nr:AlNc14C101G6033 [Albugo laibachii Nc14]|eukprot:CCA20689.1 AlNc14C101G6033 [Albugo laibachii Nc14]
MDNEITPLQFEKQNAQQLFAPASIDTEFQDLLQQVLFDPNNDARRTHHDGPHTVTFNGRKTFDTNPESVRAETPSYSEDYATPRESSQDRKKMIDESGLNYKELRKLRNRQAAARSRQRVQQKLRDLEKLADDLERKNRHLENLVHTLAAEKCGMANANGNNQIPYDVGPSEELAHNNNWFPYQNQNRAVIEQEETAYHSNNQAEDPFTNIFNCALEYANA